MDLHVVLLPMVFAASLASTERCASSLGTRMNLSLHSQRNATGHWIITVNTERSILTENQRELIVNVHQETRLCGRNKIEQLISMTTVYPPVDDTSVAGATESTVHSSATPTRLTAAPSTTATNNTPTTTITSTPKSCPQPEASAERCGLVTTIPQLGDPMHGMRLVEGYRLFPEFNCYKAFPSEGELKTWSDAREQCRRDGGDLMVMETEREREDVFIPLYKSVTWRFIYPWVGVYIPQGGDGWMTVNDEPALITWWYPCYPTKDAHRKCARADSTSGLLWNLDCAEQRNFICEIPL